MIGFVSKQAQLSNNKKSPGCCEAVSLPAALHGGDSFMPLDVQIAYLQLTEKCRMGLKKEWLLGAPTVLSSYNSTLKKCKTKTKWNATLLQKCFIWFTEKLVSQKEFCKSLWIHSEWFYGSWLTILVEALIKVRRYSNKTHKHGLINHIPTE